MTFLTIFLASVRGFKGILRQELSYGPVVLSVSMRMTELGAK